MSNTGQLAQEELSFFLRWSARTFSLPVALLVLLSHVAWGDPAFSTFALFCAGVQAAVTVIAIGYAQPGVLPVLPIMLVRLYFSMGFGVFREPRIFSITLGPIRIASRTLDTTTVAALVFVGTMLVGYLAIRPVARRFAPALSQLLDRSASYRGTDTVVVRTVAALSIALHVAVTTFANAQQLFGSFGYAATLMSAPAVSLGLLFWDGERTKSATSRLIFRSALALLCLDGFAQGMIGSVLEPIAVTVVLLWTVRGRVPMGLVIAALLALTAVNSAKHTYRLLTWHQDRTVGLIERGQNWLTALELTYAGREGEAFETSANSTALRLSSFMQVAQIFEWVPSRVPYAGSEAWVNLPASWIPRALWPAKPNTTEEFNNRYATTFYLQSHQMTQGATANLPSIGDGYWRLGWFGVALEGFLFGLLVGAYEGLALRGSRALTIIAAGFAGPTGADGHILGLIAAAPRYWVAMVAMLFVVQTLPSLISGATKTTLGGAGARAKAT